MSRSRITLAVTAAVASIMFLLAGCSSGTVPSRPPDTVSPSAIEPSDVVAVIGDFGSGDANERAVADLVAAHRPVAVVTTGDNVYSDAGYARLVGDFYGPWVAGEDFFPATGNHDYQEGIASFDAYFSYLDGQRDYQVTVGDIAFFMLDGEQSMASLDSAHNQEQWLRRAVAASTAPFRVVVVHYPPYSSGDRHGSTPEVQWDFQSMGVTLVVSGHDHIYERIQLGNVTYIVNGVGGKDLYTCADAVAGSAFCADSDFGALFLSVVQGNLHGDFVAVGGATLDDFSLAPTG